MTTQDKHFPLQDATKSLVDGKKRTQFHEKFKIIELVDLSSNARNSLAQSICNKHDNDSDSQLNVRKLIELVEQDVESKIRNVLAFYIVVRKYENYSSLVGYCSLTKLRVKSFSIAMVGESAWLDCSYEDDFLNIIPHDIQNSVSKETNLVAVLMEWIEKKCNELNIDVAIFTQQSFVSLDVPLHTIAPRIQTGLFRWKADCFGYYKLNILNNSSNGWFRIVFGTREVSCRKLLHQIQRVTVDEFLALQANSENT